MEDIQEEEYVDEVCSCKCKVKREGCCRCDCEECDPDWRPGIDSADEDTETDYDSSDSMDDVYEECGLSRDEKKILQNELRAIIEDAEATHTHEEHPLNPQQK